MFLGFPTKSDTNQEVQPHRMAVGLKFRIQKVVGLYYPCSENKGTDQLRGYRAADLRLCFSHMQKAGFLMTWLIYKPLGDNMIKSPITQTCQCNIQRNLKVVKEMIFT